MIENRGLENRLVGTLFGQALDLLHHTPDEFFGKFVTINDRNYRIGALFRENDQGYAHYLINEVSGLCLHIMQIRREYMSSPEVAKDISKKKAQAAAVLRSQMHREAKATEISMITVVEANGGSFELYEILWGAFGSPTKPIGSQIIEKSDMLAEQKNYQDAIKEIKKLLIDFPYHTVALNNISAYYLELNDYNNAIEAIEQVLEIEPNYPRYFGNQIAILLRSGHRRLALELFQQLKTRFPYYSDYDSYGIHAHLSCGEVDEASALLKCCSLPEKEIEQLSICVKAAVQARKQFIEIDRNIRERKNINTVFTGSELLRYLQKISAIYDYDPILQANLGFALFRDGQYKSALQILISAVGGMQHKYQICCCWANAAFCLIKLNNLEPAMGLLEAVASQLNLKNTSVNWVDVPCVADWLNDDFIIENTSLSASEIIETAIRTCSNKDLITENVKQLAVLYKQAAMQYSKKQSTSDKNIGASKLESFKNRLSRFRMKSQE